MKIEKLKMLRSAPLVHLFQEELRGLAISDGVPVSTRSDTGAGAGFVSGAAIRVRVRDLFFRTIFFLNE